MDTQAEEDNEPMAYEVVVPIPVRLVWSVFHDPARLAECIPGLSNDETPRHSGEGPLLTGRLRLRAGNTTITYRGVIAVAEAEDLPLAVMATAEGAEARGDAPVKAVLTIRLDDEGTSTRMVFDGTVSATGRTAELPADQLAAAWCRLVDRFAGALTEELAPVRDQEVPDVMPVRPAASLSAAIPAAEPRPRTLVVPAADPEVSRGTPLPRCLPWLAAILVGVLLTGRALRARGRRRSAARDAR